MTYCSRTTAGSVNEAVTLMLVFVVLDKFPISNVSSCSDLEKNRELINIKLPALGLTSNTINESKSTHCIIHYITDCIGGYILNTYKIIYP